MTQPKALVLLVCALVFGACGGADAPAEEEAAAPDETSGAEETPPAEPEQEEVQYAANPVLSMYVQGPSPAPGELLEGTPDDFRASVVVTNTGDGSVDVSFAYVRLEAWRERAEIDCGPRQDAVTSDGPAQLGPGEAHTYHASLHCEVADGSELEIRAYMSFGAEAPAFERERHYAGAYVVRAAGSR